MFSYSGDSDTTRHVAALEFAADNLLSAYCYLPAAPATTGKSGITSRAHDDLEVVAI